MQLVVPEKIHTPPTDEILEILTGGGRGVKDPGNPGRRGATLEKVFCRGNFTEFHAIRTFSSATLQRSQTLKIVKISSIVHIFLT